MKHWYVVVWRRIDRNENNETSYAKEENNPGMSEK